MNNYRPFAGITPAVKIIIIINVLVFLAINMIGQRANVDLVNILGMHLPQSQYFQIYQYITHMFTQKELTHLFFNMFAVFAEFVRSHVSNPRLLSELMQFVDAWNAAPASAQFAGQAEYYMQGIIQAYANAPTIGASGAVFGILLAFGMLFPNTELYLMFIPIPIKAKYFVLLYGAAELFFGLQNSVGDNVAHFAHLGGMLFGFFLILYWRKHSKKFY